MKNKRMNILLLLIAVFILVFVALRTLNTNSQTTNIADAKKVPEKVLNWNIGSEPKTIDPQLNIALDGGSVINNTFEGLFRYNGKIIEPAIASDYKVSTDGLVYTFYLKETLWSDGTSLLASDFEYAWKRALDPATASEYAYQLYYISGAREYNEGTGNLSDVKIKAIDDYTLEVTLATPTPYFLDLLTFYTYFPTKQSVVASGPDGSWAIDPEKVVSNGPFVLSEYKTGEKLVLTKNPNYWNAESVHLDKINGFMIVDESTMLTAFEAGEIDIIDSIIAAEIPSLQAQGNTFFSKPTISTYFYGFNTTVPPLDNVLVRKALSLAVDRKSLVESITKAGEIPASGFTPPGLYDVNGYEFHAIAGDYYIKTDGPDIENAKKLLAEAGYEDLKDFPKLELIYNTNESHKIIAEAIQYMWKDNLGIEVELVNQEWAVFQETKRMSNYMIAKGSWYGDYADPMSMLEIMTSANEINTTGWKNATYDQLISSARLVNGQERFNLLYQAQAILMDEAPIMPIFYTTDQFMISERIQNWEKTAMSIWYFGHVEITENN